MNDKQLKILLEGMLNELRLTLVQCQENVPENIERPIRKTLLGESGGEHEFILPIHELIERWEDRIDSLGNEE